MGDGVNSRSDCLLKTYLLDGVAALDRACVAVSITRKDSNGGSKERQREEGEEEESKDTSKHFDVEV